MIAFLLAQIGKLKAAVSSEVENNYSDYFKENDYAIRIATTGKMVVVSGVVFGTGTAGYIPLSLPIPANYNDPATLTNAIIFYARNQSTGAIVQMRCGGSFSIYREASLTNGQQYSFAFAYCK